MTQKGVEFKSRGLISSVYVNDIIQEKTVNPTVEKLKALARGLGVSEDEIFDVARQIDRTIRGDPLMEAVRTKHAELDDAQKESVKETLKMLDNHLDRLLEQQENSRQVKQKR